MGILDKIEDGEMSESSRLLRKTIPGYGYRKRERRIETDKKLREKVTRELGKARRHLDRVSDRAYEDDRRDVVGTISELLSGLSRVEQKIGTSPTGGRGGPATSATEEELVELVEYDVRLVRDAETIVTATDELEKAVLEGKTDGVERELHKLQRVVDDLERAFEDRKDIIKGL